MVSYPPPPREALNWIAVDFDGTIAQSTWSIEEPNALPGEPFEDVPFKLASIYASGKKVIVHSARPWSDYELIESYMLEHDLPFSGIVCGKLLAHAYVDDRAIHSDEYDWTGQ